MSYFRQCRLRKDGRQDQVAFLPEKYAVKDSVVMLLDDDGWVVMSVSKDHVDDAMLRSYRDAYRTARRVTDI